MKTEIWRQAVLTFQSKHQYDNPFLDVSIWASFTAPSGRVIRREAYWDGGSTYRVSFAPTECGRWRYRLEAPSETGLDGLCGELEAVPYSGELAIYRHGFLKISENGRYFIHDDGTPFFWLGDTHWGFAYAERWDESNHPEMASMFRGMVDRRVEQGFTVYQTNLRTDPDTGGRPLYWDESAASDLPNVSFYQNELDRRMQYIADHGLVNAMGQAWFYAIDHSEKSIERQKHLARYLVARYGALPICWTLAGETAGYMPGEEHERYIRDWREVAREIEALDDYGTLQTAHYTNERPFAEYYQDEAWFDFTLNQAGHGDYPIHAGLFLEHRRKHARKPFVEGEALYEYCSTLEELGTRLCTADMLRYAAYTAIQCGACGYTYGAQGIWECHWSKEDPNPMGEVFNRFNITWTEAIDGPGAVQMGYLRRFYLKNHFEQMLPYGEDRQELSWSPFSKKQPLASVSADHSRLILYYGDAVCFPGRLEGLREGCYQTKWFDPRSGEYTEGETAVPENGVWVTPRKPSVGDWLLVAEWQP